MLSTGDVVNDLKVSLSDRVCLVDFSGYEAVAKHNLKNTQKVNIKLYVLHSYLPQQTAKMCKISIKLRKSISVGRKVMVNASNI